MGSHHEHGALARVLSRQGLLTEINGRAIDWHSPEFWVAFLDDIAYRRGMGAALAEGGLRATYLLDLGADIARRFYTAWGFGGHWDGHAGTQNHIVYPFWIVSALQWATDTATHSSHGYVQNVMRWGPIPDMLANRPITGPDWDDMKAISARVYGTPMPSTPRRIAARRWRPGITTCAR